MTLSSPTDPKPDLRHAPLLEIGSATEIGFKLRLGGVSVVPTSGSVRLYDSPVQSGGALVSTTALVPGVTCTALIPATSATVPISSYEADVSYVYATKTYGFKARVFIVGQVPVFVIDDVDLETEMPELAHASRLPANQTNWRPQIEEGAYAILQFLTARGREPWLTIDPIDLRSWHMAESMARALATIPADSGTYFASEAARWRGLASSLADTCRLTYYTAPEIHQGQGVVRCGATGRPRWL